MADTMTVSSVLHFVLSQIAYIFGINAGPEHLNGQNFREAPLWVTILIALADLMIAVLVVACLIRILRKGKKMVPYLQKGFLFVAFIGACIVCSSVTIRVEMRWVYVSLAAALLFLSWMYGCLTGQMAKRGRWIQALPYLSLFTLYVLFMLPVEHYYRDFFRIYTTGQIRSVTMPWLRKPTASTVSEFLERPSISWEISLRWMSLPSQSFSAFLTG